MKRVLIISLMVLSTSFTLAQANQSFDLDKIVVTSSRFERQDYKVGSNVTVISQEQIQASNASSIPDLLKSAQGVNIYDNSTSKTAVIDIRGFGDTASRNILVLVNGRKVNAIDISGPDLEQIPLGAVERIEIIRGSGSVLYGDNAVGGVVNIITKEGKGKFSGKMSGLYGSYGSSGTSAEFLGSTKGISYYVHSDYDDQQGYRENSDVLNKDFQSSLGTKLSDWLKVMMNATWHQDNYGLPGGLNAVQLEQFGRRYTRNLSDKASSKDQALQTTFDITPLNKDLGFLVMDVSYRDRNTFGDFKSQGIATERDSDTIGLAGKYIFDKMILDHQVHFVSGFDYYDTDQNILGSGYSTDDITISKKEYGVYLSNELEVWNRVFLTGGTRYQKADYTFNQKNAPQTYQKKTPDEQVSMGGLKYEYAKGSNVFVNVQQSFRFLATDEWYSVYTGLNTNLKQQTGIQYEAGIKHNLNDTMVFNITPYIIKLKNEIFVDPTAGGGWGDNSNYDRTLRRGIEIGQTMNVLKFLPELAHVNRLNFIINYNYQDPQFDGGTFAGHQIPMVANNQASAAVTVGLFDHYETSLTGTYVGARYAINDTNNTTPALKQYFTLDGRLSYHYDFLEIFFGVNNIFGQKYYSMAVKSTNSDNKDYYPAPERNFSLGVDVKF